MNPSLSASNNLNNPISVIFLLFLIIFNFFIIFLYLISSIVSELKIFISAFEESFVYLKYEVKSNLFKTEYKSSKLIKPSASISNLRIILSSI